MQQVVFAFFPIHEIFYFMKWVRLKIVELYLFELLC